MTVHEMVTKTLQQWESSDFRDIELAIYLMYSLGEALPVSTDPYYIQVKWPNTDVFYPNFRIYHTDFKGSVPPNTFTWKFH